MCSYCLTRSSSRTVAHTLKCCRPSKTVFLCSCRLMHLLNILCESVFRLLKLYPKVIVDFRILENGDKCEFPDFVITKILLTSSGFVCGGECVPISGSVPEAAAAQCHFPVPEPLPPSLALYWSSGQSSCPTGSLRNNSHPAGGKTQKEYFTCAEVWVFSSYMISYLYLKKQQ